ncbi:flagellar hook assembly protein FlgD [Bacillus cereus]|uniref:Flagellar hook assembly protein FlgD n=4 Tax=Bacillus cereus group TaxID=86661 RepID=A0A643M9S1_BACTU|nr:MULTISPECIES: flagellar hook assembly protein FlgD [Bacillus]AGE77465.1 Flagellar hook assembly protein [Bacillus thuringiensis serovar kurstaki str. HD73]AHZ50608.1 flagellar basal body rod modification protein [Bacillus thuringiensis serovar kurstaki str. YBT-1520]AIE33006.1 flagellar basal body rod modification protein [Bacillus thuringiensis serovar kurstaki str. HD-1]AIM32788.1 flagellar hook assembly protein [Bacillus thuringiensis serovar kurstaki str. YBT-1520]AJK38699.1 hypothetica
MPTVGLNTTSTNHIPLQVGAQAKNASVNGVQSPVQQTNGVSASNQKTPGIMDKDDFLKLFLASFQHQDPFNAMDMNQMMNQTAQLSLMEQVQNMTKAVDKLQSTMYTTALDGGMKFLGKYVRGINNKGEQVTGQVETVRLAENNDVQLIVDNQVVSLRFVERVSDKPIAETNPEDEKKDDIEKNEEVKQN